MTTHHSKYANYPEVVPADAPERVPQYAHVGVQDQWQAKDERQGRQPHKAICGLSPLAFWVILLAMVIILAGAVGGGIGGGLAASNHRSSSTTSSPSTVTTTITPSFATKSSAGTTTSSATTSSASSTPTYEFYSGCPGTSGSTYTPLNVAGFNSTYKINGTDLTFEIFCNTNFADHLSGSNLGVVDVQVLYHVPTLEDCITLCASYNYALSTVGNPSWDLLCSGVGYATPAATSSDTVKCFLKTGLTNNATNVAVSGVEDSAVLQWAI